MTRKEFIKRKIIKDIRFKLEMERLFKPELLSYFNRVKKSYAVGNRNIITIQPILENHYKRIVRNFLNKKQNDEDEEKIKNAIRIFLLGRAQNQAILIDNKTQRNIEKAIRALEEEGIVNPGVDTIAKVMHQYNKARIPIIAITETQQVYEGIKNTVTLTVHDSMQDAIVDSDEERAEELALLSDDWTSYELAEMIGTEATGAELLAILALAQKMWQSMMDARVRKAHLIATGQTVPINQPFIVGGELLMYPGDTSLGASMNNVAGCRCISIY